MPNRPSNQPPAKPPESPSPKASPELPPPPPDKVLVRFDAPRTIFKGETIVVYLDDSSE